MKRYLLLITGLTLLWCTSSHTAGPAGSLGESDGANSNPHNLSSQSGNTKKADTETQICIFCHTPHGSSPAAPLWGRPAPQNMGSFLLRNGLGIANAGIVNITLYNSDNSASGDYPNGASKLCLSCHDGMTAMGVLLGSTTINMDPIGGDYAVTVELSTSHPVSFVYTSAVQTYLGASSYNVPSLTSGYLDGSSRVQCTSCHQPHQDTKGTGFGIYPFWKGAGLAADYDPVCQACHIGSPPTLPGGGPEHKYNP